MCGQKSDHKLTISCSFSFLVLLPLLLLLLAFALTFVTLGFGLLGIALSDVSLLLSARGGPLLDLQGSNHLPGDGIAVTPTPFLVPAVFPI